MTEETTQPPTLRQRIEALVHLNTYYVTYQGQTLPAARQLGVVGVGALLSILRETTDEPAPLVKAYALQQIGHADHNWGDWVPVLNEDEFPEIYATREGAQAQVDVYAAASRNQVIARLLYQQKERQQRWREHAALAAAGLRQPLEGEEPKVPTPEEVENLVLTEEQIGYRVVEIEVQP